MSTKRKSSSRPAKVEETTMPEPMDPSGPEPTSAPRTPTRRREAYAIKTLVAEVKEVFPGVSHEASNYNAFNTATDVSFDLTSVPEDEVATLSTLLSMLDADVRVARVEVEDGQALVSFHANLRTQDLRDPFGIVEAHGVLTADASTAVSEEAES